MPPPKKASPYCQEYEVLDGETKRAITNQANNFSRGKTDPVNAYFEERNRLAKQAFAGEDHRRNMYITNNVQDVSGESKYRFL